MLKKSVAVLNDEKLAASLNLPVEATLSKQYDFFLVHAKEGLTLIKTGKPPSSLNIDFTKGKLHYRRHKGGSELLIKAVGLSKNASLKILDATAGLGRDAFIMACHGGDITLLEKNALVASLLEDALLRLFQSQKEDSALKLTLVKQDSVQYLSGLEALPDVIYLDPMYPEKKKSAEVKKEMAFLQVLLPEETNTTRLFLLALEKARNRVVVKRPRHAAPLGNREPTYSLCGRGNRFDVYSYLHLK